MKKITKYYFRQCKKALRNSKLMIEAFLISIILILIKFYNYFLSPMLGIKCRFLPSCSEYCQEALKKHGIIEGGIYSLKRISRCHPIKILGAGDGVDMVPEKNIKSKGLN